MKQDPIEEAKHSARLGLDIGQLISEREAELLEVRKRMKLIEKDLRSLRNRQYQCIRKAVRWCERATQ